MIIMTITMIIMAIKNDYNNDKKMKLIMIIIMIIN